MLAGSENGMIRLGSGIFQTGADVFGFEVGIIFEDFALPHSDGKEVEDVLPPDAHPPDARPTAALVRVEGDPIHDMAMIAWGRRRVKSAEEINCFCRTIAASPAVEVAGFPPTVHMLDIPVHCADDSLLKFSKWLPCPWKSA